MAVPLSASIANATTSNVQGLFLSADIKTSLDTDISYFDQIPLRSVEGIPRAYTGSAYLGRMGSWNNQFSDRGGQYNGYNGFPSRASSTEEVRMGDFFGYTNTVSTASSYYNLPTGMQVVNAALTSSFQKYEFVNSNYYLADAGFNNIQDLYYFAYVDNNNYPNLYIMWGSGSSIPTKLEPYTTGSNYSFQSIYFSTSSRVDNTTALAISVDDGSRGDNSAISKVTNRIGVYYYTALGGYPLSTTYGVPYEVTMSAANIPQLLVHPSRKFTIETVSTTYGAKVLGSTSEYQSVPPIIGAPEDMAHSSIIVYTGYGTTTTDSGIYAKLVTLSGSQADGNAIVAFTGSRFTISPSSSYNNSTYTAVTTIGGAYTMVAHGSNSSGNTDTTCSISFFQPQNYNQAYSWGTFISNPQSYLGIITSSFGITAQPFLTASGGYGSKALAEIPTQGFYNGLNQVLLATSRGDKTIDVYVISNTGSIGSAYWKTEASFENLGYDQFAGQGYVDYTSSLSLSYLGQYRNYSASLAFDSNTTNAAIEFYYALGYTRTDGYGSIATIKIIPPQSIGGSFKEDCELYITTPTSKTVRNNIINFKDFGSYNNIINILPSRNLILSSTYPQTTAIYPFSATNTDRRARGKYFTKPLLSWYNAPGPSSLYMRDISLY